MSRVATEVRPQLIDARKVGEGSVGARTCLADARYGLGHVTVWVGELDADHDQHDCQQSNGQPATLETTSPPAHPFEANHATCAGDGLGLRPRGRPAWRIDGNRPAERLAS